MIEIRGKITLSHSDISLRSDGIVEVIIKEASSFGLNECVELLDAYKKVLEPKKYPLLHIVEDYVVFDKAARDFSASEAGLLFSKAEAYVINSLAHKILANFYMKVNRPPVPTKFFGTKDEAENWLKKYL